jgi:hypothetical protein
MLISNVEVSEEIYDFPLLAQNVKDPKYIVLFTDHTTGTIISHETLRNIGIHMKDFIPINREDTWKILPDESYVTIKVK